MTAKTRKRQATRDAITDALNHLHWNRGRGDIEKIRFLRGGRGVVRWKRSRASGGSYVFRVTLKTGPERVTVRALGSTRTETVTLFHLPA